MYKITETQIYEAKADNKKEKTDKCSIQRISTKKKLKNKYEPLTSLNQQFLNLYPTTLFCTFFSNVHG